MTDPRPIYITGEITDRQRTLFKTAKSRLGVREPMVFATARPGCGKVISFAGRPDFFCDYAIIRNAVPEVFTQVLSWYLGAPDPRAHSGADWLSEILGGTARELDPEAIED